jgi:hypothetical protein
MTHESCTLGNNWRPDALNSSLRVRAIFIVLVSMPLLR